MTNVINLAPPDDSRIWVCGCGCCTYELRGDGSIRCRDCDETPNVVTESGWFDRVKDGPSRPHWRMLPYRSMPVSEFMTHLDFMVYFTSSQWRESFGRVLAEGVAAGKVVISDPATAATFHGAVIGARPAEVNAIIAGFIKTPARYRDHVLQAQALKFGVQSAALLIKAQ